MMKRTCLILITMKRTVYIYDEENLSDTDNDEENCICDEENLSDTDYDEENCRYDEDNCHPAIDPGLYGADKSPLRQESVAASKARRVANQPFLFCRHSQHLCTLVRHFCPQIVVVAEWA